MICFQEDGGKDINHKGCWSVGGSFGLGFGGSNALPSLGKMTLYVFFGRRAVLGGIGVG